MDYVKAVLGENAIHVPAWLYVQDQGDGVVAFVGASRAPHPHPLRYGSERTHQFVVGEIVVRPHTVIGTDVLRGSGIASLLQGPHVPEDMLINGERIIG